MEAFRYYQNMVKMMTYRGSPAIEARGRAQFVADWNSLGYVITTGAPRPAGDPRGQAAVSICMIKHRGGHDNAGGFRVLLKALPTAEGTEIVMMMENMPNVNLTSIINEFLAKNAGVTLETYTRAPFSFEQPAHALVPAHRIATADEVASLAAFNLLPDMLPPLIIDDPACIWNGFKIGMVVHITRTSDTVGRTVVYKRVIGA